MVQVGMEWFPPPDQEHVSNSFCSWSQVIGLWSGVLQCAFTTVGEMHWAAQWDSTFLSLLQG